jgi:hypothetical protein
MSKTPYERLKIVAERIRDLEPGITFEKSMVIACARFPELKQQHYEALELAARHAPEPKVPTVLSPARQLRDAMEARKKQLREDGCDLESALRQAAREFRALRDDYATTGHEREEFALFMPFEMAEGEPYQWIPYLPVPGQYESPRYGTILITPERNKNFIANFKAGVYQKHLPIDAEHDLKTSGALGYIEDMRSNSDGSVDAYVKWNPRGEAAIKGDRFRYVSPEWYDEWRDPMSGASFRDVAIGGALTTRPFFKEKALRSLA